MTSTDNDKSCQSERHNIFKQGKGTLPRRLRADIRTTRPSYGSVTAPTIPASTPAMAAPLFDPAMIQPQKPSLRIRAINAGVLVREVICGSISPIYSLTPRTARITPAAVALGTLLSFSPERIGSSPPSEVSVSTFASLHGLKLGVAAWKSCTPDAGTAKVS